MAAAGEVRVDVGAWPDAEASSKGAPLLKLVTHAWKLPCTLALVMEAANHGKGLLPPRQHCAEERL